MNLRVRRLRRLRDAWNARSVELLLKVRDGSADVGKQLDAAAHAYGKAVEYDRRLRSVSLYEFLGEVDYGQ